MALFLGDIDFSHSLHFIGIGGIGMSGLAELMHRSGYRVQGSDVSNNDNIKRLKATGMDVFINHSAKYLQDIDIIVYSSSISENNEELQYARRTAKIVLHRSELLAMLAQSMQTISISGSHGKTTTTAMVAAIFEQAGIDPTVIIGGVITQYASNAKIGSSKWLILEADESDGTMLNIKSDISVITNIDNEHIDYYKSLEAMSEEFINFLNSAHNSAVMPLSMMNSGNSMQVPVLTFGDIGADIRAINIHQKNTEITEFDFVFQNETYHIKLPCLGEHNVQNALAAISIALTVGIAVADIQLGLLNFSGVKRRFSTIAEISGIRFIDDYAHHPTEIYATYLAAKSATSGKIIAVIQPHRFSRVKNFFDQFISVLGHFDYTILVDVYAAGEKHIDGCTSDDLVASVKRNKNYKTIINCKDNLSMIAESIKDIAKKGDIVLFIGAGNIYDFAREIAEMLKKELSKN